MTDHFRLAGLLKLMDKLGEPVEKTEETTYTCPFCRHDYRPNEIREMVKCLYCQGKGERAKYLTDVLDNAFTDPLLSLETLTRIAEGTRGYHSFEARRRLRRKNELESKP